MKILALIPARGGSKRLPRKNIRLLGDKPLITWSIDIARAIPDIAAVLVSTDDQEIATIAKDAGAIVPWLRPAELATDTAGSVDVALHALAWYESEYDRVDGLLLLQPTSPFRNPLLMQRGINLFRENRRAVIGVSAAKTHPYLCFEIHENRLVPFIKNANLNMRSQDWPTAYIVNGAFYLISPEKLRSGRSFFPSDSMALLIEGEPESIDIDTREDWEKAEKILIKNTPTPD